MQLKQFWGQQNKSFSFLLAILLLLSPGLFAQTSFTTNGNAFPTGNNCFTLTSDAQSQSGSVWNNSQISLNTNFDFTFQLNLGNRTNGADGIAFVLQPISTGVGASGGGIGYAGISPSLAVEYDTYSNNPTNAPSGYNDPSYDHIAIHNNGDPTVNGIVAGPVQAGASANIKDGAWHTSRIVWDANAKVLSVYFDGALRITYNNDLVANIFGGSTGVYWGFTGGTGYLQNAHQVCIGSLILGAPLVPAGALNFDGVNDYVELGNNSNLKPTTAFTYEAWVRPDNFAHPTGGAGFIIADGRDIGGQADGSGMGMDLVSGQAPRVYFFRPDHTQIALIGNPMSHSTWHHIAMTFDGTSFKLYQDGVLTNSTTFPLTTVLRGVQNMRIGRHYWETAQWNFKGSIDEVRIWNRALCIGEIQNNRSNEITLPQNGLAAYYKFNQGNVDENNSTVSNLMDASGNGNSGTLVNFNLTGSTSNWVEGHVSGTAPALAAPVLSCPGNISVSAGSTLMASYPLQNSLEEASGQLGNIILQGGIAPPNNGACQNGIYISGPIPGGQNIQTPLIPALNATNFSVEVDFNLSAYPASYAPIIIGGTSHRWLGIHMQSDGKVGIKYNNSNLSWSNTTIAIGQWYSAKLSFENGIANLYINGVLLLTQNIGTLNIGSDLNFTTSDFSNGTALNGCVRNLKISNGTSAGNTAKVNYTVPSFCGGTVTQLAGLPSGADFPIGTTVNTFQLNSNGHVSTCSFTVTVNDVENPVINCLPPVVISNDPGTCGAVVNYSLPFANDNHSTKTVTLSAGCSDGTIAFATPTSNNVSSLNFISSGDYSDIAHGHGENNIISVELFNAITNSWVLVKTILTGSGDYHFGGTSISFPAIPQVTQIRFTSTETVHCAFHFYLLEVKLNSSIITQTGGLPAGAVFPVGVTTNTFTATDSSGNTSTCSFTITVKDTEKPVVSNCTGSVQNAGDNCSWFGNGGTFTISDNCPGTLTLKEEFFDRNGNKFMADLFFVLPQGAYSLGDRTFPIGVNTVRLTVTDGEGNVSETCSFEVKVIDATAPTIVPPAPVTVNNTTGQCIATIATIGTPATNDNCGIEYVINDHPSSIYQIGNTTVTWTVKDIHGNITTATQTITVVDGEKPVILGLPVNLAVANTGGACGANVNWTAVVATDNCGVASLITTHQPGSLFPVGTTNVIYTATDVNGNNKTGGFTITVTDIEAPVAICKPITISLINGLATITGADIDNGSTDNCSTITLSASKTLFNFADLGTNVVTLTVTDAAGNSSSCTSLVTIMNEPVTIASARPAAPVSEEREKVDVEELTVHVSPNPTSVSFRFLVYSKTNSPVNIRIIDAAGRVVDALKNIPLGIPTALGSKLLSGSYVAEVTQGNERKVIKLIKVN